MSTPIENLRKHHKPCEPCIYTNHWFARTEGVHCLNCMYQWPCDTVAALDALEEGLQNLLDARPSRGQLVECDRPAGDYHLPDCPLYPHKVAP